MPIQLLRLERAIQKNAMSKTSFYGLVKAGLMPKPIVLGARSSAWLEHELDRVIQARAAGANDDQVRQLVAAMEVERKVAAQVAAMEVERKVVAQGAISS